MLTIFTTAKPFNGHNGIIQRNALKSWTLLDKDIEIIVFGDDEGSAEICAELRVRHEPFVERNQFGTVLVNGMFARAQATACHDVLCYVNCDIILMADFRRAISQTRARYPQFLMVGRRWDTDITEPIDFSSESWEEQVRQRALAARRQRDRWWIDYFAFSRGFFGPEMPAFAIGRTSWDNWLAWKSCESGLLVDASPSVIAVHQNHNYGHHPQGERGVWKGEEARGNFELAGGGGHLRTIADATLVLRNGRFKDNPVRHWVALERRVWELERVLTYSVWLPFWHSLLGVTRPVRHALGLRSKGTH
jgi:hypothetical protein